MKYLIIALVILALWLIRSIRLIKTNEYPEEADDEKEKT